MFIVTNFLLVFAIIAALVLTQNPLALLCLTFLQAAPSHLDLDELADAVAERLDDADQKHAEAGETIGFVHE
jgi:hypothetical protein